MSRGAKGESKLPAEWDRLEKAAEEAALTLDTLSRRGRETEEEVERLRRSLEEQAVVQTVASKKLTGEVQRLRAENAALQSRMLQARKRISGLMQKLAALEIEP
ncbi:MAG TPA: hypothetical protein VMN39_02060 [Longimicrobiaceae bacterium]|nr:hypothetical protein [Longimicrobiaceae bacterium]